LGMRDRERRDREKPHMRKTKRDASLIILPGDEGLHHQIRL
jgi:hypothetical protein